METSLLQTKLYTPSIRPSLVPRPHLIAKLNRERPCKLILLSAPAGYGKTTLITEWMGQLQGETACTELAKVAVCWLSLDEDDSDPHQFFNYLAAAIRPLSERHLSLPQLLQSPQPLPAKKLMTAFVNDIVPVSTPVYLILDDYHAIESVEIDKAMAFLLDHMPPHMTVVITSRTDPGFPISRLRARGQLIELRADDLRFTEAEAAEFLRQTMGLTLQPEQIAALENRTEGWIAGLQMAALSMQNRSSNDLDSFVNTFTGSHRFVLDYLVEEALSQQPESVRSFLLATSILDRLSGSLCDAVTGQTNGQTMLERLESDNLFVVLLDNQRRWYRYHHLFADVLQAHATATLPDQVTAWHRRASDWFAQQRSPGAAIRHALAAEDYERAAAVAEVAWRSMDRRYQSGTWLGWVKALPDKLARARPVLSAEYAWALLDSGEMEAAEARLQDAERWLELAAQSPDSAGEMVVASEAEYRVLPTTIANARAYLAQALGDVPGTIKYARRALELPFDDDYFGRGLSALLLGFAHWTSGDLALARQAVSDAVSDMWTVGNISFAISFTSYLADIILAQGYLHEAISVYEHALQRTREQSEGEVAETAVLHLGLSELYHELDDMKAATSHLLRSEEMGEQIAFPPWYRHWARAQARIKITQGDLDGAVEILNEASRLYFRHPVPDTRPMAALRARVWILQGNLQDTLAWAHAQGLSADDELSYLREFEHITLARLLIARYRHEQVETAVHEATGLLTRLLQAAEASNRIGSMIEILMLKALAHAAQGDVPAALALVERALTLAAPEGYVRLFVDEGPPMMALLQRIPEEGEKLREYTDRFLAAFDEQGIQPSTSSPQPLVDPLTERELEILTLIAAGLKNKEIAEQLVISLNTVLYHNKNIYSKLGVRKRALAIAKARELNLI